MKKHQSINQITGTFPGWSKVRNDEQSLGFRFLNALYTPIDKMELSLQRMRDNFYLQAANLGEIDIINKVKLPTDFTFDVDTSDPYVPKRTPPQVKGRIGTDWHQVTSADNNDIEGFWYTADPDRVEVVGPVVLPSHVIFIDESVENFPKTGSWKHYDSSGYLYISCSGEGQYMYFEEDELVRARIEIEGTTRRGIIEKETILFPWGTKQKTKKEWKEVTRISALSFPPGVLVTIQSADFDFAPYLATVNNRYSERGEKVDEFWQLGDISGKSTLQLLEYISDDARQLLIGMAEKQVVKEWELLDSNWQGILVKDLALIPYKRQAWCVTDDKRLLLYDLGEEILSSPDVLAGRTTGCDVQIEVDFRQVLLGGDMEFVLYHARPVQEVSKFRVWFQTPSGNKFGLSGSTQVPYTSDYWEYPSGKIERFLTHAYAITATERGEYILVLEVTLADGTEQTDKVVVFSAFKTPTAEFSLSSGLTASPTGIAFNSDNELVINTLTGTYKARVISDKMIIDYENKVIYLSEQYDEVTVGTAP